VGSSRRAAYHGAANPRTRNSGRDRRCAWCLALDYLSSLQGPGRCPCLSEGRLSSQVGRPRDSEDFIAESSEAVTPKPTKRREELAAHTLTLLSASPECSAVTGVVIAPVLHPKPGNANWHAAFTMHGRGAPRTLRGASEVKSPMNSIWREAEEGELRVRRVEPK
jgi:hypothetical protein